MVSPGARYVPRATVVLNAGETGFLTAQEGDDRLRWIDYSTGAATVLDDRLPQPLRYDVDEFRFTKYPADFGHGSDTVAVYTESPSPRVVLRQRGGAELGTVPVPEGQTYVAAYGDTVVTRSGAADAVTGLHLLRLRDGVVQEQKVEGLPEGWTLTISEGDARSVAVRGIKWVNSSMSQGWWVVDLATGAVRTLSTQGESVSFDRDTVFHFGAPSGDAAQVYRRDDPNAEPVTADLRDVSSYGDVVRRFGDRFVTVTPPSAGNEGGYRGNPLVLRDTAGNREKLLAVAAPSVHRTPDGSVLVAGAEQDGTYGALDWGYYLFTPAADGTVARKRLADIEHREAQPAGIALGSGILTTADDSRYYDPHTIIGGFRSTWLKTSGRPEELNSTTDMSVSGRDDDGCSTAHGIYCVTMFASGDGHHGRKAATEQDVTVLHRNGTEQWGPGVTSGLGSPQLADLSGRFGVVNQAWGGSQAVLRFEADGSGKTVLKREPVASAVWGSTLRSAVGRWDDTGSGVSTMVETKDLSTGTVTTAFDAGCVPSDLQAVGRWTYWRCSDYWHDFKGAGLYDHQTGRSLKLGADLALLGDGYLVGQSAAGLTLVDFHNGFPAGAEEADLPRRVVATATELGDRTARRAGWTVDRFGGHAAYTGADRRVRIVPSGVPASRIAVIDTDVPAADIRAGAWKPRWWLSKPAASWTLALKNRTTGAVVRTLSGGEARGLIAPEWDGKDTAGKDVANGSYTWTLAAKPADGVQADLAATGTVQVTGRGPAVRRDYAGDDGYPDLYARGTGGSLTVYRGNAAGTVSAKADGGVWPTTSTLVPFGDLDGDNANDTLVTEQDGSLYRYSPERGKAVTPDTPRTRIGSGWAAFDGLTYSGDLTADGVPDLVARQTATGDLYLFAGTKAGGFTRTGRIGTSWKSLTIVGAGDLNGDRHADLIARTANGDLYRYYGTGKGTISSGTKIGSG
ncbi:FG-GAP-like repeat-containing protein, partial [Streptomyces sp. NPDC003691]